jgi:hypothetical protein
MKTRAELSAEYIEKIGYDPFEDDPTISEAEVASILSEHDILAFNAEWEDRINLAASAGNVEEVERLMIAQSVAFVERFPISG